MGRTRTTPDLRLETLIGFLHAQDPHDEAGSRLSTTDCPLARLARAQGFDDAEVNEREVAWCRGVRGMHCRSRLTPAASAFVPRFDQMRVHYTVRPTIALAKRILREVGR